jgi:hypothetical protein
MEEESSPSGGPRWYRVSESRRPFYSRWLKAKGKRRRFNLFSRSPKSAPVKRSSFRPNLERLEARDCPSTVSLMCYTMSSSKNVTIMGSVRDTPSPGGLTVALSGVVSGTVTTDSYGSFSAVLPATGLGTVNAATTDGQSNTAQFTLMDTMAPQISSFYAMESTGDMFVFRGHVNNFVAGETISFSGMVKDMRGVTTTINQNGDFALAVEMDGLADDNGSVYAVASADAWGVESNTASVWISQT